MLDELIKWLYPDKCASCGKLMDIYKNEWLCPSCKDAFAELSGPVCKKCGAFRCCCPKGEGFHFDKNISFFLYDENMRRAIHSFKYGKKLSQGRALGKLMADAFKKRNIDVQDYDYIVPVPIHKERLRERGFNQSEILAMKISEITKIPLSTKIVKRIKDTIPQSTLSYEGRLKNVKNSFKVSKASNIYRKNIILIDDIFTSGSTADAVSKVLKENGAAKVLSVTLSLAEKHYIS